MEKDSFRLLNFENLKRIVDNAYDEIFVYDNNFQVVYVNKACVRHYGLTQDQIIGSDFHELQSDEMWYPSVLPRVYEEKRQLTIMQTSFLGEKLITTAVPIFDRNHEIEYVVMSVHDASCELIDQRNAFEKQASGRTEVEQSGLPDPIDDKWEICTQSEEMKRVIEFAERIANYDSTVLIHGESGTGKTFFARYIHNNSIRKDAPLLTLNCAAIPEHLLESELFGYEAGAFTGASKSGKKGLIELASGGTVLLDEIGEVSMAVQAKLLQLIQEKAYIPVGGSQMKTADVRMIAATNKNLLLQVEKKLFREDLYWRLNVVEIEILPLRQRKKDIHFFSEYFLKAFNDKHRCNKTISSECMNFFMAYSWPGNIRQLENLIERLTITSQGDRIEKSDLPQLMFKDIVVRDQFEMEGSFDYMLEQYEARVVKKAFEKHNSTRKLAEALKISQTKAARLIRKYCK